jgi:hypothetical protein
MNWVKAHITFSCIVLLLGCDTLSSKKVLNTNTESSFVVARVGNNLLNRGDIANLGVARSDSAEVAEKFVLNWIKKELLVQKASQENNIDLSEIEQKVDDYRYALISFEYQKLIIQQQLNTEVSDEEIEAYYLNNKNSFVLRQNILRGRYLKLNQEAQKIRAVKRWIRSDRPKDLESLQEYAFQFADNYSLEDSTWIKFDDIIKNSPFSTLTNKVQFLKTNRYVEEKDSLYLYLLKINEYKISEDISPLEFVKDDIRNIIINKRKVALVKELENKIFEEAQKDEDYQIYR